ncbi:DUF1826 domain-containing protein [Fulvimarina pelagi]|uniref:DUF1826 domain-containing protein n=1 Tax=Fulvimarina pelagi TaxID=217511 RepID=UPI0009D64BB8|nr:DUF1826 domain-containing protein [Fulvimarina pelagi]
MSALRNWSAPLVEDAPVIRLDACPSVLETLNQYSTELAVWQRPLPDYYQWLGALPVECLPRLRWTGLAKDVYAAVDEACEESGTPDGLDRTCLLLDIASLASRFSDVLKSDRIAVRLDVNRGQTCPRWHRDAVTARLLCTLRGPGTEFHDVSSGVETPEIFRMACGEVGIVRGTNWAGAAHMRLLHRSPPATIGPSRLLLVIELVELDDNGERHPT